MIASHRRYLLAAVALVAATAVGEVLPRPYRGLSLGDLQRALRVADGNRNETRQRLRDGWRPADDGVAIARFERSAAEMRREMVVRDVQTAMVLALGVLCGGWALFRGLPTAWRRRGERRRSGTVEVAEEETLHLTPEEASTALTALYPARHRAIDALRRTPRVRCIYCDAEIRLETLGRVGRRVLLKRPPPGAADLRIRLGDGWWAIPAPVPPCATCGSAAPA